MPRTRQWRRSVAWVSTSLLLLGTSAACKSPGGGDNSSAARGVTSTSIKVAGLVTATTGSNPAPYANASVGAEARFWLANQSGGVNGRKISYAGALDDGGSAATFQTNLSKQVLQNKVFAIVPSISYAPMSDGFIDQHTVPVFGNALSPGACSSDLVFSVLGCAINPQYAETTAAAAPAQYLTGKLPDATTGAISAPPASPAGPPAGNTFGVVATSDLAVVLPILKASTKAVGWDNCYLRASVPPTGTTDFSPFAAAIMRECGGAGPAALLLAVSSTQYAAGLIQAMRNAGWKGQPVYGQYDAAALKSPELASALNGAITFTDGFGLPETNAPEYALIRQALAGIGNQNTSIDLGFLFGWASADLFIQGLQNVGRDLTPQNMKAILNNNWKVPGRNGFYGPVQFPLNHRQEVPCWSIVRIENAAYKAVAPLTCGQVIEVATGAVVDRGFTTLSPG